MSLKKVIRRLQIEEAKRRPQPKRSKFQQFYDRLRWTEKRNRYLERAWVALQQSQNLYLDEAARVAARQRYQYYCKAARYRQNDTPANRAYALRRRFVK